MKILFLADEEVKIYWDFFKKEDFKDIDLIISCGDLKASYLSFLATMTGITVLYVRGNHDDAYAENPPEGCVCIEDKVFEYNGLRIVGLGGCRRYKQGLNQYTDKEMEKRVRRLKFKLFCKKGFDILVTHAPASGFHDSEDLCHQGFGAFNKMIEQYQPRYFVHGHVHMSYGRQFPREDMMGNTMVINAYERYVVEI